VQRYGAEGDSGPERDEVTGKWRRVLSCVLLTKYYVGDQIKKNEVDGACMYGGKERCIQNFGGET
jgi:hypothetical protein